RRSPRIGQRMALLLLETRSEQAIDGAFQRRPAIVRMDDRPRAIDETFAEVTGRVARTHDFLEIPQRLVDLAELAAQPAELCGDGNLPITGGAQAGQLGADVAQLFPIGQPLALDLQHGESIEEIRWSDIDLHGRAPHLLALHIRFPCRRRISIPSRVTLQGRPAALRAAAHRSEMRREKLALFPGGFNPRQALADIAVAALTVPATLEGAALEPVITALAFDPVEAERCEQALSTLAAVLYARPELLGPGVIDALAVLLRTRPFPQAIGWTTLRIFEFLASTARAALAWSQLMKLLRDQDLDLQRRQRVLPVAREFVDWSRDVVDIDDILALARSFPPPDRAFLFDHGVDRFVFRTPEAFTVERLRQIFETFGDAPRYPHVLYSLASRPGLSADANAVLAREL